MLEVFLWELSLWNFCFGTFALELALRSFRLETSVWELLFGETFAWELWLRKIRLGTSLGNFGVGWIFGFGSLAWNLWVGIWGLGNWDPEAGGTAWP